MNNSYIFISTNLDSIFQKSKDLLSPRYKYTDLEVKGKKNNRIYYLNNLGNGIYYAIAINRIKNDLLEDKIYQLEKNEVADFKNEHTLQSFAWVKDDREFYCNSDYLGVFTHYYYFDNENFIASDNLVIIAKLINARFSIDGVFDAILFKKPFGANTWYENIFCLIAGTMLKYDLSNSEIAKYGGTNFIDLLTGNKDDFAGIFEEIFSKFSEGSDILLSLSAGSDSRTVLAGLLNARVPFKAFSWGGKSYLESKKIQDLISKFKIDWRIIDFDKLQEDYFNYYYRSIFLSNGLIPAVHHFYYRSCLPRNAILYEGYGGSEFIKGEHSDGMYSDILKSIIKDKISLKNSLVKFMPELNVSFINKINEYLQDNYNYYFNDIDTNEGMESFQLYLFNFLPSKIFGGIFKPSDNFGLKLIEPYFSPKILASFFGNGLGIKENLSLRRDFPGSIRSIKPQAHLLKRLNSIIYSSMLDRNIKYSEWNYPGILIYPIQKIRQQIDKIFFHKYKIRSQVDYGNFAKHREVINTYNEIRYFLPDFPFYIRNSTLANIEVYLSALKHCSDISFIKAAINND